MCVSKSVTFDKGAVEPNSSLVTQFSDFRQRDLSLVHELIIITSILSNLELPQRHRQIESTPRYRSMWHTNSIAGLFEHSLEPWPALSARVHETLDESMTIC